MDDDALALARMLAALVNKRELSRSLDLVRQQFARSGDALGLLALEAVRPDDEHSVSRLAAAIERRLPKGLIGRTYRDGAGRRRVRRPHDVAARSGSNDRIVIEGRWDVALDLLLRVAELVGDIEGVDLSARQFEVLVNRGDEIFAVLVTVHESGEETEASFVARNLEHGIEISPRPFMQRFLDVFAAPFSLYDEVPVAVYADTDDEATFRQVVKHVEELAEHLGFGQSVRVG